MRRSSTWADAWEEEQLQGSGDPPSFVGGDALTLAPRDSTVSLGLSASRSQEYLACSDGRVHISCDSFSTSFESWCPENIGTPGGSEDRDSSPATPPLVEAGSRMPQVDAPSLVEAGSRTPPADAMPAVICVVPVVCLPYEVPPPPRHAPSFGSLGHPRACAAACKYAKKRGCKDGAQCTRCHLCVWSRHRERYTTRRKPHALEVAQWPAFTL